MTIRDHDRLVGVHPVLIGVIASVLDEMDSDGHQMFVIEGVRADARQAELYAQGRTSQGPIVTYKDGVTHRSNHQAREGFGWAVDCGFTGPQPFDYRHPWETYGKALESRGITWGGRWKMADKPHAEYIPTGLVKA